MRRTLIQTVFAGLLCAAGLRAQADSEPAPAAERWNLYWQATSIGQYHGNFPAAYQGANSLDSTPERDVSLTTTFFLGFRLGQNTQVYFDPEIAGGRGFSGVTGLANFSNGELPRVASATPKPYIARLYISHDFAFGSETEASESGENQLAGTRPSRRYTVTVGRFTVTDFFDNNRYSHDPRTQFMGWAVMYNGAWDYPADTRGYTWGWVHELRLKQWSWRYASAAEPTQANGGRFDRRLLRDRGDMGEGEYRFAVKKHPGAVRLLGFLLHTHSGNYGDALRMSGTPDVEQTRKFGTLKYGWGLNFDQELLKDVGVFGRLGWNDGQTQSYAFTAIDRLATGGVSVTGTRWSRPFDTAAAEITTSGLSPVHASYLARGGLDFLIGDGRLNYGRETIWESYYNARLLPGFFAGLDLQHVTNPAFNRDRGPLWIASLRLHLEYGSNNFR